MGWLKWMGTGSFAGLEGFRILRRVLFAQLELIMSHFKLAVLFLCVAMAGCAGKSETPDTALKQGAPAAAKAAQADAAKANEPAEKRSRWWSSASKDSKPAAERAPVETAKVSQAWLDNYEQQLRKAVAGSRFEVERRGEVLVVVAPVDPSFNPDRPHMLLPVTLGPLSRLAKLVENDAQAAVLVLGHADSSGDSALNRKLSLERAQAVASIFRMSGLRNDRLMLRGVGADKPRASNDSASGRAQNRRVEVLLTLRDSLPALVAQNDR